MFEFSLHALPSFRLNSVAARCRMGRAARDLTWRLDIGAVKFKAVGGGVLSTVPVKFSQVHLGETPGALEGSQEACHSFHRMRSPPEDTTSVLRRERIEIDVGSLHRELSDRAHEFDWASATVLKGLNRINSPLQVLKKSLVIGILKSHCRQFLSSFFLKFELLLDLRNFPNPCPEDHDEYRHGNDERNRKGCRLKGETRVAS